MAVPASVTTREMTGTYMLNKKLSDSSQATLRLQNVNFIVRQAIEWSSIIVTMKHYTDDKDGKAHLDTTQVSTGGMKNEENWVLDGEDREKTNWIWGQVKGYFRYVKLSEIQDAYLKEGWGQDGVDGDFIEGFQASQTDSWTAQQVVGFAEVDGQRRQVRRFLVKKGQREERIRVIYDWKP